MSQAEQGETHKNLEKFGCKTFSDIVLRKSSLQYYKDRISRLAKFCNEHQIDIVYSHFQEANLISVLAQFFCKSKFVITRHHTDCAFLDNNWKERWSDRIINSLSKIYVATSPMVWRQIVDVERTNPKKVRLINYGYNFQAFQTVNPQRVEQIKKKYSSEILLVKAARFIPEKRHADLVEAMKHLIEKGYNVKLLLLGRGPLEDTIKLKIQNESLADHVFMIGFQLDVMDYFAAADLVVHFSLSEASNSAIKEAAITDTPVAVCRDVGDFDDYIVHGLNGILLAKENPISSLIETIDNIVKGEYDLAEMGRQLHKDVVARFDISNVAKEYREINLKIAR
jgi:glycosyltransferase involved in cell wall biosynthesis